MQGKNALEPVATTTSIQRRTRALPWGLLGATGALVALASVASVTLGVMAGLIAVVVVIFRSSLARRLEDLDRAHRRRVRRTRRRARLSPDSLSVFSLSELTRQVEAIERMAPSESRSFDLDGLLDYYATVAVARDRSATILASAGTEYGSREDKAPPLREIHEQRTAVRLSLQAQLRACDQELTAIDALVQLVTLRCARQLLTAKLDPAELEERVLQLHSEDAAAELAGDHGR